MPVTLSGLRPGQTYRLMTADADGRRMPAGSLRAADARLYTRVMTAMSRKRPTALAHPQVLGQGYPSPSAIASHAPRVRRHRVDGQPSVLRLLLSSPRVHFPRMQALTR
ncbi:hypothetical protein ACFY8K_37890 [Streptomyces misionensis]|uniref:hypothetical protein n=1 Tax=Streptomyces misionensis TaxID=67331 RepID=UPI0036A24E91